MLFPYCLFLRTTKNNILSVGKASSLPLWFPSRTYQLSILCHNLIWRDTDCLSLPQNISLDHYIDKIWPCDQEVSTTLDLLVTCTQIKGWEINPTKVQGHSTSVKFGEVQWYGAFRDIPSKVKDNLLCLAPLTTKKEAQHPVCLFEFWIQQFLTWMCFSSLPIHQMLRNLLDLIEVWSRHSFWSWIFHFYM